MSRQLVVEPEAESDILGGYLWYEERQNGLGSRFIEELEASFDRIVANPGLYLAVEAAESGISLNRVVSAKLAH